MNKRLPLRCGLTLLVAAVAPLAAFDAAASVVEKSIHVAGVDVRYKVVLPSGYDATKAYPAIIVMGGGPQTMDSVDRALERYFRAEAERRGYIVIAPAASNDERFFEEGGRIFPEFLDEVVGQYRIVDRKFHAAGWSNGGISSLHVAAAHPEYFLSVTAFPGYLWRPTDEKLLALSGICVFLYIGQNDEFPWHSEMRREAEFLRAHGTRATYTVEIGQPHRIETLAGPNAARLFDGFEVAERGCKLKQSSVIAPEQTVQKLMAEYQRAEIVNGFGPLNEHEAHRLAVSHCDDREAFGLLRHVAAARPRTRFGVVAMANRGELGVARYPDDLEPERRELERRPNRVGEDRTRAENEQRHGLQSLHTVAPNAAHRGFSLRV